MPPTLRLSLPDTAEARLCRRGTILRAGSAILVGILACALAALSTGAPASAPEPASTAGATATATATVSATATAATSDMSYRLLDPSEVTTLVPTGLRETLRLSGETRPARQVTLSAQVTGLAGEMPYLPGDTVAAGARLLTIAPEDYRLELEAEQAALQSLIVQRDAARMARTRTDRLAASGTVAQTALEKTQSETEILAAAIRAADTRVRQAAIRLERATVHAPFGGILASRLVEPGQLVQAGDALFTLVDITGLTFEARIPASAAARLVPGQPATLWSPEGPERRFAARVQRIGPQTIAGTRSLPVWLELDNRSAGLSSGVFLTGEIILREAAHRLALPPTAIRQQGGASSVLVLREGRAVSVPVTPGASWQGGAMIEITSGLHAGDQVVILPLSGLAPGDRVQIAGAQP